MALLCVPLFAYSQQNLVETLQDTGTTDIESQLNGRINSVSDYNSANAYFIYDRDTSDDTSCVGENLDPNRIIKALISDDGTFSGQLRNLEPDTRYYFRACLELETSPEPFSGQIRTFATDEKDLEEVITTGGGGGDSDGDRSVVVGPDVNGTCKDDGGDGIIVPCPDQDQDGITAPNEKGKCFSLENPQEVDCADRNGDGITDQADANGNCYLNLGITANPGGKTAVDCQPVESIVVGKDGKCYNSLGSDATCPAPISGEEGSGTITGPTIPSIGDIDLDNPFNDNFDRTDNGIVPCGGADCTFNDLVSLFNGLISIGLGLGVLYIVLRAGFAGFKFLTAGGNAGVMSEQRKIMFDLLIGLIIVATAWLLVSFITSNFISDDFITDTGTEDIDFLDNDR